MIPCVVGMFEDVCIVDVIVIAVDDIIVDVVVITVDECKSLPIVHKDISTKLMAIIRQLYIKSLLHVFHNVLHVRSTVKAAYGNIQFFFLFKTSYNKKMHHLFWFYQF